MASSPPPPSASLGQLAVVLEVISREDHRGLSKQIQAHARRGNPVSYARLLVRLGIPSQSVEELLRRGATLDAVRCDACGASVPQAKLTKRREYPCLRCGALLLGFRAYASPAGSPPAARPPNLEGSGPERFNRAPGQRPRPSTGLDMELPTITHGQVLPLPGEGDRRRDLDLPTPSARLGKRQQVSDPQVEGTLKYRDVLQSPEILDDALSTIGFGHVLVLPGRSRVELSDEDLVTEYGALTSEQGSVVIEDSAAPEEYAEIGGYQVLSALGEGGMGRVYLARHGQTGREVALKVLRGTLATDADFLQRFHREAEAITGERHPNVVEMISAGHDDLYDMHYIAFEYVAGGTLEDKIHDEGALPEEDALRVALGIAKGLAFTAGLGIIHRDVKPSNVILTAAGMPKLADLGLARHLDATTRVTQDGVVLGTPAYIAPEQATDVEDLDVRADLYALGICLYEMLTTKLPLEEGALTIELLLRHVEEDVPDVRLEAPGVSAETAQLVKGLTARDRDDRYATPEAAIFDIKRVVAHKEPLGPREAARRSEPAPQAGKFEAAPPPVAPAPKSKERKAKGRKPPSAPKAPVAPRAPVSPLATTVDLGEPPPPPKKSSGLLLLGALVAIMLTVVVAGLAAAYRYGWLHL